MRRTKTLSHYPPKVAAAVVIANMIGTGVFTSLGFQLVDIQSAPAIMMLWLIGGLSALCGALSYAELGAALPRSGGEYHFLTEIYHPCAGFISGWVSATVGFAAPTALAALTFGSYLNSSGVNIEPVWLATVAIFALTAAHCSTHRHSGDTQTLFTLLKLLLILAFSLAALTFSPLERKADFIWNTQTMALMGSGAFAVSLIYVNYAYSGWNAATYISGELASPQNSLPWVLGISTAVGSGALLPAEFRFSVRCTDGGDGGKSRGGCHRGGVCLRHEDWQCNGLASRIAADFDHQRHDPCWPTRTPPDWARLPPICAAGARERRWHPGHRHHSAIGHRPTVPVDRLLRTDFGVFRRNDGPKHLCHRAGFIYFAVAPTPAATPLPRHAVPLHTVDFPRDHWVDAHICCVAAPNRSADFNRRHYQRWPVLSVRQTSNSPKIVTEAPLCCVSATLGFIKASSRRIFSFDSVLSARVPVCHEGKRESTQSPGEK